jgi:hypothetical protein
MGFGGDAAVKTPESKKTRKAGFLEQAGNLSLIT